MNQERIKQTLKLNWEAQQAKAKAQSLYQQWQDSYEACSPKEQNEVIRIIKALQHLEKQQRRKAQASKPDDVID